MADTLKKYVTNIGMQMDEFKTEAENASNGNKAAGRRVRKLSSSITRDLKEFRRLSVKAEK